MASSLLGISSKDSFSQFLKISLIVHIGAGFLIGFKAKFFPSDDIIIPNSIRVDMVALPDKVTPSKPTPPTPKVKKKTPTKAKPKKPVPRKPKKVVLKKTPSKKSLKSDQSNALDKVKAMMALEKIKEEMKVEKEKQAAEAAALAAQVETAKKKAQEYKGNILNDGSSLTGLNKLQFDRYYDDLKNQLKANWTLPQWLANANLKAQALLLLDEQGNVIKFQILQSSGNEVFDSSIINAIKKSSPFRPPPSRLRSALQSGGIVFNFPE